MPGTGDAGAFGRDEIRNIIGHQYGLITSNVSGTFSVPISSGRAYPNAGSLSSWIEGKAIFDASNIVPTGPENVPPHVWSPVAVYLGTHA